ncbi:hypothetical protein [Candidatus Nitrososphaera sp. FF02]|uniref:hypothetical protein n=1 Tax=Candidatus Nitrososphaera sp. FF02 TaxID=3398226 RepID=UPI0039E8EBC3
MSESRDSVKDLKAEAKWASETDEQKQSIEELASHGREAIPALEEVKTVTTQDDIRNEVDAAIRGIKGKTSTEQKKASRAPRKTGKSARKPQRKAAGPKKKARNPDKGRMRR